MVDCSLDSKPQCASLGHLLAILKLPRLVHLKQGSDEDGATCYLLRYKRKPSSSNLDLLTSMDFRVAQCTGGAVLGGESPAGTS